MGAGKFIRYGHRPRFNNPEGNISTFEALGLWDHQPVKRRRHWAMTALIVAFSIMIIASAAALTYVHVSAHAITLFHNVQRSEQSMKTRVTRQLEDALLQAQIAREAAERANERTRAELARQQQANELAEASLREAREQIAMERSRHFAAEHDREDALARLTAMMKRSGLKETAAREAFDLAAKERRLRLAAEHSRDVALRRHKAERDVARQPASNGWGSPFPNWQLIVRNVKFFTDIRVSVKGEKSRNHSRSQEPRE